MTEYRGRSCMGPWRLLDIMHAAMPLRGGMLGGSPRLPEYGPPDAPMKAGDPAIELPDSNIDAHEWRRRSSASGLAACCACEHVGRSPLRPLVEM